MTNVVHYEKYYYWCGSSKRCDSGLCFHKQKVPSNTEMTPSEFIEFFANSKALTIVFEACGTSNYWKQKSIYSKVRNAQFRLIASGLPLCKKVSYMDPASFTTTFSIYLIGKVASVYSASY
jgi:hypothetical protein